MQRQLIILIPVSLMVMFLESQGWRALGYLLGSDYRNIFRVISYILGIAPIALAVIAEALPEQISTALSDYFYYHLMILFFLFMVTLVLLGVVKAYLFFSKGEVLRPLWLLQALALLSFVLTGLLLAIGLRNAAYPKLHTYNITVAKNIAVAEQMGQTEKNEKINQLRIIAISDIHWETLANQNVVRRSVDLINSREPDLVLILGDTVTRDSQPFLSDNGAELLGSIKAKYGVFAILGNHDYYDGRVNELVAAYTQAGVTVLCDEATLIADSVWLIGRDDIGGMRSQALRDRASLPSLLERVNMSQPVIVLDHQPRDLAYNATLGIDLELSGHTHAGQMWPVTYIAERLYDLNQGLQIIGNSHFIVTSGVGYWGPPVRLGTHCEVSEINIRFNTLK